METYHGIRYAHAERFSKPVQEPDLKDINDLNMQAVICPQNPSRLDTHIGLDTHEVKMQQSEDCLRLSIYTPSIEGKHPVLVWIHGGAFITGSGLNSRFDATSLSEMGDMVVVNISYRLGALGFLYHPKHRIVNLGLEDQICALRWVKANIHLFGGDPGNVTIFGQSAGGTSVMHLIASVEEPLFSKAIIASAPFLPSSARHASKTTRKFHSFLGRDPYASSICEILYAQAEAIRHSNPGMPFAPVREDYKTPEHIAPGLKSVLMWCQKDDAYPFVPFSAITRPATKIIFKHPIFKYAKYLRQKGIATTCKVMDWRHGDSIYGAEHCMELPLLFNNWDYWHTSPFMAGVSREEYETEAMKLKKLVVNVVKGE